MKKWAFIICLAIFTASCNGLLNSKPSGTLSKSKMVDVLVDIHITEASIRMGNDPTLKLNDTIGLRIRFADVFRKHNISPDNFNQSLDFYLKHVEELDAIYSEVISRLTLLDAKLQGTETPIMRQSNQHKKLLGPDFMNNIWFKTLENNPKEDNTPYFDNVPQSSKKESC